MKGRTPNEATSTSAVFSAPPRVLVVDDEDAMLRSIQTVLSDDLEVTACYSAERALELLAIRSFHVVCADYKMPGMDGLELLRRVAALPQFTSGLLLTGSTDYQFEPGRHYVLLKPFDPARLIAVVLQLARVAEMKRSVTELTSSVRKDV